MLMKNERWQNFPIIIHSPISSLMLNKELYKIDKTYQRAPGIWTKTMEQYLIDSILRGYSVPPIIIHKKGQERFIVDGQQRWNAIIKFERVKDPLELNKKYSRDIIDENNGEVKYRELLEEWRNRFNSYPMTLYLLEDYSDEEIRTTFLRLQESKPLTPGERLNAYPGDIVLAMRELSKHKFFHNSLSLKITRYKDLKLAATFLFLEKKGIKSISPIYLYNFFIKNRNLSKNSQDYKKVKNTLNYLRKIFPSSTGELRTEAWIVSTYLLASCLLKDYAIGDKYEDLKEFITEFYLMVDEAKAGQDRELLDFREAVTKGTNNEKFIRLRHEIMLQRFLDKNNPPRLDENRLFSPEQRLKIFNRDKERCQISGEKLDFNDENTHYHHKIMHSIGGSTTVENGQLVCMDCHYNKIHGKKERVKNMHARL